MHTPSSDRNHGHDDNFRQHKPLGTWKELERNDNKLSLNTHQLNPNAVRAELLPSGLAMNRKRLFGSTEEMVLKIGSREASMIIHNIYGWSALCASYWYWCLPFRKRQWRSWYWVSGYETQPDVWICSRSRVWRSDGKGRRVGTWGWAGSRLESRSGLDLRTLLYSIQCLNNISLLSYRHIYYALCIMLHGFFTHSVWKLLVVLEAEALVFLLRYIYEAGVIRIRRSVFCIRHLETFVAGR